MEQMRSLAGITVLAIAAMGAAMGFQNYRANPVLQAQVLSYVPDFARPYLAVQTNPVEVAIAEPSTPQPVRIASLAAQIPLPPAITAAPPAIQPAPPAIVPQPEDSAVQADAVAERVKESVLPELFSYFHTYLYVSKAASGAWAQHMFVFHRADNGRLVFDDSFPVSTGRERREKYFTSTPTGLFELDPNRFDAHHRSHRWGGAPMPWAMFLNYTIHGHLAGIALHSGIGHIAFLGQRASGGCVRMPPEKAEYYFKKFRAEEYGQVPVFAFDGDTTATDGHVIRDMTGHPQLTEGYRVLLIIQDVPGGPALVAMLS
jgi:lipoprotein-anchoring transpeptidase ErfK/SrfK